MQNEKKLKLRQDVMYTHVVLISPICIGRIAILKLTHAFRAFLVVLRLFQRYKSKNDETALFVWNTNNRRRASLIIKPHIVIYFRLLTFSAP